MGAFAATVRRWRRPLSSLSPTVDLSANCHPGSHRHDRRTRRVERVTVTLATIT